MTLQDYCVIDLSDHMTLQDYCIIDLSDSKTLQDYCVIDLSDPSNRESLLPNCPTVYILRIFRIGCGVSRGQYMTVAVTVWVWT